MDPEWSISPPDAGSIDPEKGLYHAPETIAEPIDVTVTAKSKADHAKTAHLTFKLTPP
jgi:hypothetical protein